MTITNKVTLCVIGTLFGLFAILAVAEFSNNLTLLKKEMQFQAESSLHTLSVSVIPILETGDRENSEIFFSAIMSEGTQLQHVKLMWLFDGDVQTWSHQSNTHQEVPGWFMALGFLEPLTLETQVNNGWTDLATLTVSLTPDYAYLALWKFSVQFVLFTVAVMLVTALLIRLVLGRALTPISVMTEGARRIAKLDFPSPLPAPKGNELVELTAAFNDMSSQVESLFETLNEEINALRQRYLFDSPSGFHNRNFFVRQLESWLEDGDSGIVMLVNLKWLTRNSLSENGEDLNKVMRSLRQELSGVIPKTQNALIARMSKIELAILLPSVDEKQTRTILGPLIRTLNNQVISSGQSTANAFIIGITEKKENDSASSLLSRANATLQDAESTRQVFHFSVADKAYSEEQLGTKLTEVVNTEAFELMAQPIISKTTQTVQHYEVYAHLKLDNQVIPASKLISTLSRYSLSTKFDKSVINHVAAILLGDLHVPPLSINLTSSSVRNSDFLKWLVQTVKKNKLENRIFFEFSESLVSLHPKDCEVVSKALREAGLRFGIDRFGQNLNSVAYLKQLKPAFVKLEQSFLQNQQDDSNHLLLKPMVKLASTLGIDVIVSAVEYQQQLNSLADIKVDGYFGYISPPIPLLSLLNSGLENVSIRSH
ncbi:bifunctional diguanylate cyclase/phosphodiesterase [Grimontia sp. NTOU-MAR1]|uniref:bifunctional diguanylate cyclase/phosphodiesterase n=1 Tax=Grimontia sp. NTOU-MAR1 TaxID=3111011 RepID=UPI002DBC84DB|nr:EAL domain-containing protein [Grimontia sp. NTOU-MAR1]WRV97797.1 EAL domain-containing protein [Grimontia sp. NTOU-MAR1]